MYKKQKNPSAILSQQLITKSLFELLKKRRFENITITEICKKAGVMRKTFYSNFDAIEDIIGYKMDIVIEEIFSTFDFINDTPETMVKKAYSNITKTKEEISLLYKNNLVFILLDRIKYILKTDTIFMINFEFIENGNYYIAAIAAIIASILELWIERDYQETHEELSSIANTLLSSIYFNNTFILSKEKK